MAPYLAGSDRLPVLDVGAGTGVFALAFAFWFEREVIGVEPSVEMRRLAETERSHPRVRYLAGDAASVPLPDSSCDAAWLSTVVHHVPDLPACAAEMRRLVSPPGKVLIRSAFPGRLDRIALFRYFPVAKKVAESFPTLDSVVAAFGTAGFERERLLAVPQRSAPNLREFRKRLDETRAADSTLSRISDDDFLQGVEAVDRDLARGPADEPVVDWLDLLVLG